MLRTEPDYENVEVTVLNVDDFLHFYRSGQYEISVTRSCCHDEILPDCLHLSLDEIVSDLFAR